MIYLLLFLVSLPTPFLAYAEVLVILGGLSASLYWPLVALAVGLGQVTGFLLVYFFGDFLVSRWTWLSRKLESVDFEKHGKKQTSALIMGGFLGFPPVTLMGLAGTRFVKRWQRFALIILPTRTLRFFMLAAMPHAFASIFDQSALPKWLQNIF